VPRRFVAVAALAAIALVASCSSDDNAEPPAVNVTTTSGSRTSTSTVPAQPLHVLVTNDDGVDAPGIDALVEALRKLPDTTVTVVAPAKNQSGTGSKTTSGAFPMVTDTTTASGYPAKAVDGFPADTIVWAIDKHGVATRPDVVLSGVNFGQNIGLTVDISGTVGAARAAARRGIPALAISAGLAGSPAYGIGARQAVAWLTMHRAELRDAEYNLELTTVRAPGPGFVTQLALRPGMYPMPAPFKPAMVFVNVDDTALAAGFQQNALLRVRPGDEAEVAFDAAPGRIFKGKVRHVLDVISTGQLQASGALQEIGERTQEGRAVAIIDLEAEAAAFKFPGGSAAQVALYTPHWHHFAIIRRILLRMRSWQNYIFLEGH